VYYCKRCVLPNTKPGLKIDIEGICSACRAVELKKTIDWSERSAKLHKICDGIRGKNKNGYDCLVPVSGGKDSIMQVYTMSQKYNLNVLAVNVVAHVQTVEGIENLNSMVENLGVDLITISVRPSTHKRIRKMALIKVGNPNYAEHRVVFAAVARSAYFYKIPLVVWGEDIGVEFGGNIDKDSLEDGDAKELINNDLFREIEFDSLISDASLNDELLFYKPPELNEIKNANIKSIYLGYYQWWDGIKHYKIAKTFGFKGRKSGPLPGNYLNYDNIDEKLCEVHLWLKFLKLGFWRPTDHTCYNIWNGYMNRPEAVEIVNSLQYDFPAYIEEFLEFHQISEDEFFRVAEGFRNKEIFVKKSNKWRLRNELT
jgi:N-acetyl sugar amidotransferase